MQKTSTVLRITYHCDVTRCPYHDVAVKDVIECCLCAHDFCTLCASKQRKDVCRDCSSAIVEHYNEENAEHAAHIKRWAEKWKALVNKIREEIIDNDASKI